MKTPKEKTTEELTDDEINFIFEDFRDNHEKKSKTLNENEPLTEEQLLLMYLLML